MKKLLLSSFLLLGVFFCNAFAQNVSRNIYINIFTPQNMIVKAQTYTNQYFSPTSKDKYGYKTTIILPKVSVENMTRNTFGFTIDSLVDNKIVTSNIIMPFNSIEEIFNKQVINLYVSGEPLPLGSESQYVTKRDEVTGLHFTSNENFEVSSKGYADVDTTLKFPNILGLLSQTPVFFVAIAVFLLSFSYRLRRKDIIKL